METIDLYRSYLAQTAILNAVGRAGGGLSGAPLSISPGRGFEYGFTAETSEAAIVSARKMPWLKAQRVIGFSLASSSIRMYLKDWHGSDVARRIEVFKKLRQEMPGEHMILTDDDEVIIAGIIHGQTYTIRVGKMPGHKKD